MANLVWSRENEINDENTTIGDEVINQHGTHSIVVGKTKNNEFILVKDYDTPMEHGMVFVNCEDEEGVFTIIERFPNSDRNKSMPKTLRERALKGEDFDDSLCNCGYVSWFENGRFYAYTEYYDNHINTPY